jgi:PEGA domain
MAWLTTRTVHSRALWLVMATLGVALLHSTACATMARGAGGTQEVIVTSAPAGARVFIGNTIVGLTPVRLDLKRRDNHIVLRFEKEGFEPRQIPVKQSVSGWLALDLFPLNPYICQGLNSADQCPTKWQRAGALTLAFGLDFLTGAAYTLPPAVHAVLTPPLAPGRASPRHRRERGLTGG